jgi:hypothetical protein
VPLGYGRSPLHSLASASKALPGFFMRGRMGGMLASNFDGLLKFYLLLFTPFCLLLIIGIILMLSAGYRRELRSLRMLVCAALVAFALACLVFWLNDL